MHDIAKLTTTASRMLNALLLHGAGVWNSQPKTRQMQCIGATSTTAFREARLQLAQEGFIKIERHPGKDSTVTLSVQCTFLSSTVVGYKDIYSILEGSSDDSTGQPSDGYSHSDVGVVLPLERGTTIETLGCTPIETLGSVNGYSHSDVVHVQTLGSSLIERCREVDEMDESGAITSTKSPFGLRRLAQIPLVQEAYKTYFPEDTHELNPLNAKAWLSASNNKSEDVVERLQDIAQRKPGVPLAYITKVFRGEAQRTVEPVLSSTVPYVTAAWDGELMEPSEDWKAKAQRAQQLAASIWRED